MPSVGWDGRDVSGLSHEQIHRWTRDGARPEALAAARDRHLARADELRGAADRLQAAQRGVGETWAGRDADAAGNRTRVLAQRMEQLAETVGGQARGLDGMRTALVRVQAAVGPPRPPALPALGVTPVLDELRALVTGRPADGYGAFRTAAADQVAAREAYRAYLGETATAARAVGSAGVGPAPAAAPGRAPLPAGARGAANGVLQRAAGPVPTSGAGAPPTTAAGPRPPDPAAGAPQVPVRAPGAVPAGSSIGAQGSGGAPGPGGVAAPGAGPAGPGGTGAGSVATRGSGPVGAGGGAGTTVAGPPTRTGAGPHAAAPSPSPGGPVAGPAPTRRPDGRERAPSAVRGPAGPPRVLDAHRPGDFGPDATPPAVDGPPPEPDDEQPVVPVRHVTWLVDPDPAGWGAPGRRVVPPVLGEGP